MTKYGFISDVHKNPLDEHGNDRIVVPSIEILKNQGIDKLILNGDIGNSQNFIGYVLDSAGKSGIETYVQPGSHEKFDDFKDVMDSMKEKYSNLISCFDKNRTNRGLIFLPGSDFLCGGEYQLGVEDLETGVYNTNKGKIGFTNMRDLYDLVNEPEKEIVVSHVPRKFDDLKYGVDMAEFGEVTDNFLLDDRRVERGSVFPGIAAENLERQGAPIELKKENRGNESLKKIFDNLGIRKSITGHFHESVGRACDSKGNYVKENEMNNELFWNASYCDDGKIGILEVNDNKVKYNNLNLRDFLR